MYFFTFRLLPAIATTITFSLALAATPAVRAQDTIICFNEAPTQAANGLSVLGVTFGFTINGVASNDAVFNTVTGPAVGTTTFTQAPNLEGNALGILTLNFDTPTSIVNFGFARNTQATPNPSVTVQLFDNGNNLISTSTTNATVQPGFLFPEGFFSSNGPLVKRASLSFNNPAAVPRFVIDNLAFNRNAVAAVPEPSEWLAMGMATASVGGLMLRARRRKSGAIG